jgi:hypothetical protein
VKHKKVNILGMDLIGWEHKSCVAYFAVGKDWATLYDIESKIEGKGHATELLIEAKKYYEKLGKTVGGSVALNMRMRSLYKKVKYKEYGANTK